MCQQDRVIERRCRVWIDDGVTVAVYEYDPAVGHSSTADGWNGLRIDAGAHRYICPAFDGFRPRDVHGRQHVVGGGRHAAVLHEVLKTGDSETQDDGRDEDGDHQLKQRKTGLSESFHATYYTTQAIVLIKLSD